MKVYFENVLFNNNAPLLWQVDEENQRAVCLYRCQNQTDELSHEEVNASLKDTSGIDFIQSTAVIADFTTFKKAHTCFKVTELFSEKTDPVPEDLFCIFESPEDSQEEGRAPDSNSVSFDTLLFNQAGSTLSYRQLADNNQQTIINLMQSEMLSSNSIDTLEYIILKQHIIALRKIQILLLQKIYEQYLLPVYNEHYYASEHASDDSTVRETPVLNYLRNAALKIMRNDPQQPTPYPPEKKRISLRRKPKFFEKNLYEKAQASAEAKMREISILVGSNSVPEDSMETELSTDAIRNFQSSLQPDKKNISKHLLTLKNLRILIDVLSMETSKIDLGQYHINGVVNLASLVDDLNNLYSSSPLLKYALSVTEMEKPPIDTIPAVHPYYSLRTQINNALEKTNGSRINKDVRNRLCQTGMTNAKQKIKENVESTPDCENIKTLFLALRQDSDIYLNAQQYDALQEKLEEFVSSSKNQHSQLLSRVKSKVVRQSNPEVESKLNEDFSHLISEFMSDFFNTEENNIELSNKASETSVHS